MIDRPPWLTKIYTGVGSRETPTDIQKLEVKIARRLAELGYILRSGGAIGSDIAWESGANKKQIFYHTQQRADYYGGIYIPIDENHEAYKIAASIHPNWKACNPNARLLHSRNLFQVLGADLSLPSDFLICWTPCGAESDAECVYDPNGISTGGTATAIRAAERYGVPVYNLQKKGRFEEFCDMMKKIVDK